MQYYVTKDRHIFSVHGIWSVPSVRRTIITPERNYLLTFPRLVFKFENSKESRGGSLWTTLWVGGVDQLLPKLDNLTEDTGIRVYPLRLPNLVSEFGMCLGSYWVTVTENLGFIPYNFRGYDDDQILQFAKKVEDYFWSTTFINHLPELYIFLQKWADRSKDINWIPDWEFFRTFSVDYRRFYLLGTSQVTTMNITVL